LPFAILLIAVAPVGFGAAACTPPNEEQVPHQ